MQINENVYLIRKDFYVTNEVKRYVNIYLITGKYCYLIDTGVSGTEALISDYMKTIGRELTEIKGVFLTHAHPDHIGAAAEIKRRTGCHVYAPVQGLSWIENIQKQFAERPIPNFFKLLSESVKVDSPLSDGQVIELEKGLSIKAIATPGHSDDSMSYILNDETVFMGDAIPAPNDLPIFVHFEKCVKSIEKIRKLDGVVNYCPAWDKVYIGEELKEICVNSEERLYKLRVIVHEVEKEMAEASDIERKQEICIRANMLNFSGNPLFMRSIDACKESE